MKLITLIRYPIPRQKPGQRRLGSPQPAPVFLTHLSSRPHSSSQVHVLAVGVGEGVLLLGPSEQTLVGVQVIELGQSALVMTHGIVNRGGGSVIWLMARVAKRSKNAISLQGSV